MMLVPDNRIITNQHNITGWTPQDSSGCTTESKSSVD